MKFRLLIILILCPFIIIACDSPTEKLKDTELTIYTSIYPLQFIAEQITGETATVKSIYPPGVDAHSYEPTTREITNIATGNALIYLGENMEGFAETIAEALDSHQINFIEIGKHRELFIKYDEDSHHSHADLDPHIWLDPLRMIDIAFIIQKEMAILAPNHAQLFEDNFHALQKSLQELDNDFLETIQPKSKKNIIVAHAAYGYWEERYGIKQIPISGVTAGNEPSQKELTEIVAFAKEENIPYVIYEQNSSDRISTIIQDYLQVDDLYIHNLEVLTDQDIKNREDYFSLMKKNLKVIDQATY